VARCWNPSRQFGVLNPHLFADHEDHCAVQGSFDLPQFCRVCSYQYGVLKWVEVLEQVCICQSYSSLRTTNMLECTRTGLSIVIVHLVLSIDMPECVGFGARWASADFSLFALHGTLVKICLFPFLAFDDASFTHGVASPMNHLLIYHPTEFATLPLASVPFLCSLICPVCSCSPGRVAAPVLCFEGDCFAPLLFCYSAQGRSRARTIFLKCLSVHPNRTVSRFFESETEVLSSFVAAQVEAAMRDVRAAGVDVMTFGQYMRPTKRHMPVSEYVTPEGFNSWRRLGEDMVRCSWQVEEADGDN
jgi:hypothetical protein